MNEGSPRASVLGIVCSGGFLQGEQTIENGPFIFPLQLGINILIGDRGSGKSTTLDMLSLLVNSFRSQTQDDNEWEVQDNNEWEAQEHNISEWIASERKNFYTTGYLRVFKALKKRSVKKYVCYFYKKQNSEIEKNEQKLYAFYADVETSYWHLFYREQNIWLPSLEDPVQIFPEMLILRQGDILQIVQNENKLVINQILEALNFSLKKQRLKLSKFFDMLANEYINLKQIKVLQEELAEDTDEELAEDTKEELAEDTKEELAEDTKEELAEDTKEELAEDTKEELAEDRQSKKVRQTRGLSKFKIDSQRIDEFIDKHKRDIEIFKQASQDSNKINEALEKLESYLQDYYHDWMARPKASLLSLFKSGERGLRSLYVGLISDYLEKEIKKIKTEIDITKQCNLLMSISDVLAERILKINEIREHLKDVYEWNNDINEICTKSIVFFNKQSKLIQTQKEYCNTIKKKLMFLPEQKIAFSFAQDEYFNLKEELTNNEERYKILNLNLREINESFLNEDLDISLTTLKAYNSSLSTLLNILEKIEKASSLYLEKNKSIFVDFPVELKLKQGQIDRPFEQLSFGQRSAIILTILSTMTNAEMIIIDQPEDNLDSDAIVKILTSTILKVSEKGAVIIATHRSSLVMGLGEQRSKLYLYIMESRGEFGGIRRCGKVTDPNIVEDMFDILEGGLEAWQVKLRYFGVFTDDLVIIENSYLSDIIASLRNVIQPRKTLEELITQLRHDLKNRPLSIPNSELLSSELLSTVQFDSLIEALEKQDKEIIETINNIKSLSIGSNPQEFELYSLIEEMTNSSDIDYQLDPQLKGILIYADIDNIQMVFRNLFDNSLNAIIEAREERELMEIDDDYRGKISIEVLKNKAPLLIIIMRDNGIGIHPNIKDKIYKEHCPKQGLDGDVGLGTIFIKNLLRENKGEIKIDYENTKYGGFNSGTVQIITFKTRVSKE